MKIKPVEIGGMIIDPIHLIPAGILTTTPDTCERFSREGYVGGVVTKTTTSLSRFGNQEPTFVQVAPNAFINAVGYKNIGIKKFLEEFSDVNPLKPIGASITSTSVKGFGYLARNIRGPFRFIEGVVSCPHTQGYGVEGGFSSPEIIREVTEAIVKESNGMPVGIKLPPDTSKIKDLAKAAKDGGATFLSGVNTIRGTVIDDYTGKPILTNRFGGISGEGVSGVGIECTYLMRKAVKDLPFIMGLGIESAKTGRQYLQAGKHDVALYIGTALRGMNTDQVNEFFRRFEDDLLNDTNEAEKMVTKEWIMRYEPYKIVNVEEKGEEIKVFTFDKGIKASPGQFVFVRLPRKGRKSSEKPFSIARNNPLTIAVRKVGDFTSRMYDLDVGDEVMNRGPYGSRIKITNGKAFLVGGGTGLAPMYSIATELKEPTIFMGARTEEELLFEKEFSELGEVIVTTDDGSKGRKEFVTDALERYLHEDRIDSNSFFYNCGPERMLKKAVDIEINYTKPENILTSIERYSACGVGVCGLCSLEGSRSCVDGPFHDAKFLKNSEDFGNFKKDAKGAKVPI
jgi:dihydroorotate dehydrogenase subfamily 1